MEEKVLIRAEYLKNLRKTAKEIWKMMENDADMEVNMRAKVAFLIGQVNASSILEKFGKVEE